MRLRRTLIVLATACGLALTALPASAHHAEEHTGYEGCYDPPAYTNPVSGFSVAANGIGANGIRSRDVYLYADASPDEGLTVAVFQPYWDSRGPTRGPHWVDASVTVGPGGATYCNNSRLPG